MTNTERVNLNINIQLQSLRAAFAELTKIQNKVTEIQTGKIATSTGPTNLQLQAVQRIDAERRAKIEMVQAVKAEATKELESENVADLRRREMIAKRITTERNAQINSIAEVKAAATAEYEADIARRTEIAKRIDTERKEKIKSINAIKAEVAKEAAEEQKMWTNAIKQAFSLHIIQMYIQPFVNALNRLLRTTLTTFAEFDKYYADYLGKSADFADVVSKGEIYAGAVNKVYSINNMADAMERFAASGIDLTQNQQALTDVLHLSVTAAISYDEAANSVIKTQEAFQLTVNDSTMIVDALTNSANASTAELKDLTEWFGYASGMSHEAGINVQQLAAYLGILSSMGMKSAGTAFRQMLVQMTDENVRQKLQAAFGQEFDFLNMDETLLRMRAYVQTSSNQAEVIQRISSALGGKVNARESLARLLTADEQTWNRIMQATERSGTAAELFDTMTDNASASLDKIKNNMTLILAQLGEIFAPILDVIVYITGGIAKLITIMPSFAKGLIGIGIGIAGIFAVGMTFFVSMVGLYYMVAAANQMFANESLKAAFSVKQLYVNMKQLSMGLIQHITLTNSATAANQRLGQAMKLNVRMSKNMKLSMAAGIGMMVAYMGQQYAMEQQSYGLATALNMVSSALTGIMIGTAVGGPLGAILGGAVGLGMGYTNQKNITRAQEESTLARRRTSQYGKSDITQYNDTGAKNYFNIQQVTIPNVSNPEDLATGLYKESYL